MQCLKFPVCITTPSFSEVGMEGEVGLVAGRSQREKRRSYKDLLREEEEIAAQVRKSSKKRPKVTAEHWFQKVVPCSFCWL